MKWVVRGALVLAALLILLVGGLFVVSSREGAGRNEVEILIDRPPETVFTWITEPEKLEAWIGGLVDTEPLTEGGLTVGARSREHIEMDGRKFTMETVITSLEPNRSLGVNVSGPDILVHALYELTPVNGATRLRYTSKTIFQEFGISLLEPIVTPAIQKKLEEDFETLRSLAEAGG